MEQKRQKIMLVDDSMVNLAIGKNMLSDHYEVYALPSASRLFAFLERVTPDLILLDINMPEMDGYEAISILKKNKRYVDIPIIFITAKISEADELKGLTLGAIDYVTKPFSAARLLKRIENHLLIQQQKAKLKDLNDNLLKKVRERTKRLFELQNSVISTVAELVEFRDNATGGHVSRTQKYLETLMGKLIDDGVYTDELLAWDMDFLLPSAQLHDVGKISIPDSILNKPGQLTSEEFVIMKSHVEKGVEAIIKMKGDGEGNKFLEYARNIAGTHHEKWDGSGYPYGLKGRDIPLEGRLMAIADVYDALISVRPYKKPFSAEKAARIIIEGSGTHFDPALVEVFKKLLDEFASIAKSYNQGLI